MQAPCFSLYTDHLDLLGKCRWVAFRGFNPPVAFGIHVPRPAGQSSTWGKQSGGAEMALALGLYLSTISHPDPGTTFARFRLSIPRLANMSASGGPPPLPSNPAENDGARIAAATLTVTVAAFITYLARIYARLILVRNTGWDDYFMTLAMAVSISGEGVIWGSVANGAGQHLGDIPLQSLGAGLKLNFISQAIYLIAICVVKLTVGAMLLRIASTALYRRLIISLMVSMGLWTTMCVVVSSPLYHLLFPSWARTV